MAKKAILAWAPIRDLMKSVGAQVVSKDAVDLMRSHLEQLARDIASKALKYTQHAKRVKVAKEDIRLVIG